MIKSDIFYFLLCILFPIPVTMIYGMILERKHKVYHIGKKQFEDALSLISMLGNVIYETNIEYMDSELENQIKIISEYYKEEWVSRFRGDGEVILFYDGFGCDERGLAQIYLKALCKIKKIL